MQIYCNPLKRIYPQFLKIVLFLQFLSESKSISDTQFNAPSSPVENTVESTQVQNNSSYLSSPLAQNIISQFSTKLQEDNFKDKNPTFTLNRNTSVLTFKTQRKDKRPFKLNSSSADTTQSIFIVPDETPSFFKFYNENGFETFYIFRQNEQDKNVQNQSYWILKGFLWNANSNSLSDNTLKVGNLTKNYNFGIWVKSNFPPYMGKDYEDDEFADYDQAKTKSVDAERKKSQEKRWEENSRMRRKEPKYVDEINPMYEIYTHVRWYGNDYNKNTKIELDEKNEKTKDFVNHFKGYFFGNCKAKTVKRDQFPAANTTKAIVEFYAILLREHCNPKAKELYLSFFDKGYLSLNKTKLDVVYVELNKEIELFKSKTLKIWEIEELQKLLLFYGYSQVYQSLISFPTDTICPTGKQITTRVFILLNTIIHIQETILEVGSDHHEIVVLYWIQKLKPILLQIWCEFLTQTKILNRGAISRMKYDSMSVAILMEYLLISLQKVPDSLEPDPHHTFEKLYTTGINNSNKNETYLQAYKDKTMELKKDLAYKEQCLRWMYPDMQK